MTKYNSVQPCDKCRRPYLGWGVNPAEHTCPENQTAWMIWHAQLMISERMDQADRCGRTGDTGNRARIERDVEWWLGRLDDLRDEQAEAARALLDSIEFPDIAVSYPRWMVAGGDAR